jgi:hypothetical protein
MKLSRLFPIVAALLVLAVAAPAVVPVITGDGASAQAKRPSKPKKPKKKPKPAKTVTYTGKGVIDSIDTEEEVLSVNFTSANRDLRKVLGGSTSGVDVIIGDDTAFLVDGAEGDIGDICAGDTVSVSLKTKKKLSGGFNGQPADKISVTTSGEDCLDNDLEDFPTDENVG